MPIAITGAVQGVNARFGTISQARDARTADGERDAVSRRPVVTATAGSEPSYAGILTTNPVTPPPSVAQLAQRRDQARAVVAPPRPPAAPPRDGADDRGDASASGADNTVITTPRATPARPPRTTAQVRAEASYGAVARTPAGPATGPAGPLALVAG